MMKVETGARLRNGRKLKFDWRNWYLWAKICQMCYRKAIYIILCWKFPNNQIYLVWKFIFYKLWNNQFSVKSFLFKSLWSVHFFLYIHLNRINNSSIKISRSNGNYSLCSSWFLHKSFTMSMISPGWLSFQWVSPYFLFTFNFS